MSTPIAGLQVPTAERRGPARASDQPRLPPASVLAVLDDPAVRDLLLEIALDEGYGVYCASGALEALAVLGRERPGAVLVDLDMANAKGLRFLDIFRQLQRHEDVMCLAVTARAGVQLPADVRIIPKSALGHLSYLLKTHFAACETARGGEG